MSEEQTLSSSDVNLMLAVFPELKEDSNLPKNPDPDTMFKYISEKTKELGEENVHGMLEYLTTAAAMKIVLQENTGKSNNQACEILAKENTAKNESITANVADSANSAEVRQFSQDLRESMASMSFAAAAEMFPLQQSIVKAMNDENFIDAALASDEHIFDKMNYFSQILGENETGGGRSFTPDYFRSLTYDKVKRVKMINNVKSFVNLNYLANRLQGKAVRGLANKEEFKSVNGLTRDPVTTAFIRQFAADRNISLGNSPLEITNTIKNIADRIPEVKKLAHASIPLADIYFSKTDALKGSCEILNDTTKIAGATELAAEMRKLCPKTNRPATQEKQYA